MITWSAPDELSIIIGNAIRVYCLRCGWTGVKAELVDDSGAERCSYDVDDPARHGCELCPGCKSDKTAAEDLSDDDVGG
jgi:hypothetical protein